MPNLTQFKDRQEDGRDALLNSLQTKKAGIPQYIIALAGLQELREIAWQKAIKYRFDPVLGRAHDEYLQFLNGLLKEFLNIAVV